MNATMFSVADNFDPKWKSISIGDAKYSICASESDGSWKVSLTNLIEIWTEDLDTVKILQKCEKLNPSLSIEDIDVQEIVRQILEDIPKHANKVSVEQIKLSCELEGDIFEFSIDFTRGSAQQLWEEVTMPLCLAAGELRRRHIILLDLVKKKDAEISEYKLNGAELIRKHIKTEPFHEDIFKKNAPTQNAESCHDAFQTIMELQGDVKIERRSVKTEPPKPCQTEALNIAKTSVNIDETSVKIEENSVNIEETSVKIEENSVNIEETSVKIEVEEHLDESNTDLAINNETSSKIEDNLPPETVNQESNDVVPKVEKESSPETSQLPKPSKSETEIKNGKMYTLKRTQSAPTLRTKRTRKNIHDFIK